MRKNKNIKTYEQYLADTELFKSIVDKPVSSKYIEDVNIRTYKKRFFNDRLMIDVIKKDKMNESKDDVINLINRGQFIDDVKEFYDSFNKSDKISFLTPYKLEELKEFKCYKLRGYNIGFAVKKDGDIILVHNNENVGGIGKILIEKAVKFGGKHLDHFDGFLTGFYKSCNFSLESNDLFNDNWAPKEWEYKSVNVWDENYSIYPKELSVSEEDMFLAETRYDSGKPDIVYRTYKK